MDDLTKQLLEEIKEPLKAEKEAGANEVIDDAVRRLKSNSPVDTGKLRSSWVRTDIDPRTGEAYIENSTDYVELVNGGTSAQAPQRFIEQSLLSLPDTEVEGEIYKEL
jgi:HK97 gp10 family phage protein